MEPLIPKPAAPKTPSFAGIEAGEGKELIPGMKFRWCPEGTFTMGRPANELGRYNEDDLVEVTLSPRFWLGETEVTQEQWNSIMKVAPWTERGGAKEGDNYPATGIAHSPRTAYSFPLVDGYFADIDLGNDPETAESESKKLFKEYQKLLGKFDEKNALAFQNANTAAKFCELLTQQERNSGRLPVEWQYSLPTEAQ